MDGTTTIKIDYYEELKRKADFVDKMISPSANEIYKEFEELKAKADKYDEKEKPFKPTEQKVIQINFGKVLTVGKCKCGVEVNCLENYCFKCGQRLVEGTTNHVLDFDKGGLK